MPEKMRQLFDRFLLIGLLGLILTTIWKPANRLATIILCLINIIVIGVFVALILLGLMVLVLSQ